jgi:geranylgeranyl pyrophosphate synthase
MTPETAEHRQEEDPCYRNDLIQSLRDEFNCFQELSYADNPEFFKILYDRIYDKYDSLPLRAHTAFLLYKYIQAEGGNNPHIPSHFYEQQFPFILEVVIAVQYYHNQILDGKAGVTTSEKINDNLVIGNLLKDQLYRYIDEKVDLPESYRTKLVTTVRTIFEWVDIGQYIDKHCNTYKVFQSNIYDYPFRNKTESYIKQDYIDFCVELTRQIIPQWRKEEYLRIYFQRIYLTSALLYRLSTEFLIECILNIDIGKKYKLVDFFTLFGLATQIVNDNIEFVPSVKGEKTNTKEIYDAFSDLKNGNITLPIFIDLIRRPIGMIYIYLNRPEDRKQMGPATEDSFFKEICDSDAIYYSISIAKKIGNAMLVLLNKVNPYYIFIYQRVEMIENNRYYRYFYSYKEEKSLKNDKNTRNNSKIAKRNKANSYV